jgi:hypothetical protein
MGMSDLVPHVLGYPPKWLELCDLIEHNPEPIVYTLVISRKIMTGYVTASSISVLEDEFPQWYEPGMISMHDNALIHRVKKILDWLRLHNVEFTE